MIGLGNTVTGSDVFNSDRSIEFDGTDNFLSAGDNNNLGAGNFSFSFWIKASDTASNFLFSKREDDGNRWYVRTEGNSRVQFYAKKSGSDVMTATSSSSGELSANVWNHIVIACDRSDSSTGLKFYINGQLENSRPTSTTDIDNTGLFYIGRFNTNYTKAGTKLTEIGIFNVALGGSAVTAIYNETGSTGKPINLLINKGDYNNSSNLVAYYKMGGGLFDDIGKREGLGTRVRGAVVNQVGASITGNLITASKNSAFDASGDTNWTAYDESGSNGTTTVASNGSILTVTLSGATQKDGVASTTIDSGAQLANSYVSSDVLDERLYYVKADVWRGTANSSDYRIYLGGPTIQIGNTSGSPLPTSKTTFDGHWLTSNTGNLKIYNNSVNGDTGTIFIDNVRVHKLPARSCVVYNQPTVSDDTP